MRSPEEVKFLNFLIEDIKTLENALLNKEEDLRDIFKLIRKTIPFITIEFSYFIELLNKYCFSILNKIEIQKIEDTILFNRFNLFKRIFIKNTEKIEYFTKASVFLHDSHSGGPVYEPILFILLCRFYRIYYKCG